MMAAIIARLAPYKLALTIGAGVATGALAFGAGWVVNGWRLDSEISRLTAAHAEQRARQVTGALTTLQADTEAIHKAATEYAGIETTLAPKIAALTKELRNAKPLPVDCRPDALRVRNLDSAIDAANQVAPR
jgi:hypothetical protein